MAHSERGGGYLSYMNQRVFAPAGLSWVSMTPTSHEPSMIYPFPAGIFANGDTIGDWFTTGAGGGLQMSTDDVTQVMLKVKDGTLLHPWSQAAMDMGNLGWDANGTARHGYFSRKEGGFPPQPNGGALESTLVSFSSGLQVSFVFNSPLPLPFRNDSRQMIIDAYNASWVPTE